MEVIRESFTNNNNAGRRTSTAGSVASENLEEDQLSRRESVATERRESTVGNVEVSRRESVATERRESTVGNVDAELSRRESVSAERRVSTVGNVDAELSRRESVSAERRVSTVGNVEVSRRESVTTERRVSNADQSLLLSRRDSTNHARKSSVALSESPSRLPLSEKRESVDARNAGLPPRPPETILPQRGLFGITNSTQTRPMSSSSSATDVEERESKAGKARDMVKVAKKEIETKKFECAPTERMTWKRQQERAMEDLILKEHFSTWITELTGIRVTPENFCNDLYDGIALCRMLAKVIEPSKMPAFRDPPDRSKMFDIHKLSNLTIFSRTAKLMGVRIVPAAEKLTDNVIIPCLLEVTAFANSAWEVAVPNAIVKRIEADTSIAAAIDAMNNEKDEQNRKSSGQSTISDSIASMDSASNNESIPIVKKDSMSRTTTIAAAVQQRRVSSSAGVKSEVDETKSSRGVRFDSSSLSEISHKKSISKGRSSSSSKSGGSNACFIPTLLLLLLILLWLLFGGRNN